MPPGHTLEGILVVSLEQAVAAPYCSSRLADAGARVIKIEREGGDFARGYDRVVHGESAYFVWLNRGKESLQLDIKSPQDSALLAAILARADVFIQNLAPGAAARAGLGSGDLRKRHPRLITCDISGYGEVPEVRHLKAYDLLVQAESGLCSVTGTPEQPSRVGVSICDIACGMYAYTAVLEALIRRAQTGAGSAIETSLFGGIADWMNVPLLHFDYAGRAPARTGLSHPSIQPYGAYPTRGGAPILISVQNEREFATLCGEVLGRPELAADPRFCDNPARCSHREALHGIIAEAFTGMDRGDLIERLAAARIAYGEVNDVAGLSGHPALRRVGVGSPSGPIDMAAPPARVDGRDPELGPVPAVGEHTAAIRREFSDA